MRGLKEILGILIFVFQVIGLSVSPGDDQLIVVHIPTNDLVVCLVIEDKVNRVAECMAILYLQIFRYVI